MRHLAREAANYHKLLVPKEEPDTLVSRSLSRLNRWGGQTSYPFLLNAYRLYEGGAIDAGEFAEVLGIIESFLVRRMFARVHTGQLNRLFLSLYHQLPEGAGLAEGTRAVLSEPSRRWPRDDDFRKAVVELPLYTDGRAEQRRLILETMEESYGTKEPVDLSALTIEHVMPRTLTAEWLAALGEFAEERHQRLVHTIGNLTLTGYNSELSNGPFHAKRAKLAQSNVEMNKEIAREEKWGFAQIEERGEWLAELALAIWPGPAPAGASPGTAPSAPLRAKGTETAEGGGPIGAPETDKAPRQTLPTEQEPPGLRDPLEAKARATHTSRPASIGGLGEAERHVRLILPDAGTRQGCLQMFADAIDEAHTQGRAKWAITQQTSGVRKVRLVVGHIIVCTLGNGRIWLALDKGMLDAQNNKQILEQSLDWEWGGGPFAEYRQIPSRNGHYRPSESNGDIWLAVQRLHFESIRKAANHTTMDPRTPSKHSPDILRYLEEELGRRLPDPLY